MARPRQPAAHDGEQQNYRKEDLESIARRGTMPGKQEIVIGCMKIPILALAVAGASFSFAAEKQAMPWDFKKLSASPKFAESPGHNTGDVKAVFYEGLPWKGKPTRVFAYYGIPKIEGGGKAPAMVLVHGGGGSAFSQWVQLWMKRGYAAIAMDTCGCIPGGGSGHKHHPDGGPPGWGNFNQVDQPPEDQWTFHAVADVVLAHSLIRSLPGVDPDRIGLTGISWGGYLACIAASVDRRFKFAAPVYGCGFLGDNSTWVEALKALGPERSAKWLQLWDPSKYLPLVAMPMLWVDGTNDFAYPMDSLRKSYLLPRGPRTLCLRVRMPHGHGGPGENPPEIFAMAESLFRGRAPLARVTGSGRSGRDAWATFEYKVPLAKAELNYTADTGPWVNRKWLTLPADLDVETGRISAVLPEETTVYYFNLADNRGLIVSSEHEEILAAQDKP